MGFEQCGSAHSGGGAGAGKVNVQDLSFTKWVDSASPKLALACCAGKHFKDAVLVVRKAGDKPVEYLKIKMEVVLISAVSTGGSGGEDRLTENVTLNFSKVSLDYVPQDDKGAPGTAIPMTWDISTNSNN
jgi:type VI secretion system secreted protein Hcp